METSNSENRDETVKYDDGTGPVDESVTTVELPERLVSRVEQRLDRTSYDSAAEYIAFVLEETLARVEAETDDDAVALDEAEVQDRLESLGYLDS